ncbi:unnamed protein product [Staurois parvus]|uniref:Uncharacterized protein n=1 Tax=Staurois parvus TaxID=386267 RepID=A0ABN9B0E8_9NEOB|nr:unnamed protein product [Staurois parvus]
MTAGCPVRMSEKHMCFVIGPAASGICHVSQVPPYHSQKAPLHAHLAPGCHAQCPHYRSRKTARCWIEEQVRSKNKEAKSRIHFGRAREPHVRHPWAIEISLS